MSRNAVLPRLAQADIRSTLGPIGGIVLTVRSLLLSCGIRLKDGILRQALSLARPRLRAASNTGPSEMEKS
jgi:hypothetical protein